MLTQKFERSDLKGLIENAQSLKSSTPKEVVKQWGRTYFIGEEQIIPDQRELIDLVKKAKKGGSIEDLLG
ncbi:MAG: hypothetical protein LBO09_03220 [Candidatus Peribacteria bacterium]|jgi:hypothetical protein|nr:hypothetical protein [Candidatus Peribacteria bacterium]